MTTRSQKRDDKDGKHITPEKLRVAVWAGLSEKKCLEHVSGLDGSELVRDGILFRQHPVAGLKKFRQICPPKPIRFSTILSHLYAFLAGIVVSVFARPDVCIGISMIPHSICARIAQTLTGSKFITWLIGTDMYVHLPQTWFGKKILAPLMRSADCTLCMGQNSKKLLTSLGWDGEKTIVGRNAYDFSDFFATPPRERWENGEWDIIFTGRLDRYHKRVHLLLQTVAELKKEKADVTCAIVGNGPDYGRLQKIRKLLDIKENVSFLGHRKDIPDILNNARIFVMTSAWEGLPSSIIEALVCGLPVVTSTAGDVADIIENDVNGILVPLDRPGDYARAILSLLRDRDLYESMSCNARRTGEDMVKQIANGESARRWTVALRKGRTEASAHRL